MVDWPGLWVMSWGGLLSRRLIAGMLLFSLSLPAGALSISGFSPAFGKTGNVVTVTGSGFNSATAVAFNSASPIFGDFTNLSDTQLLVIVPPGATTGPLLVFSSTTSASSPATFSVAPFITAFYPQSGTNPTPVNIMGGNFVNGGTSVIFPGLTNRVSATYVAQNQIVATVPVGAGDGPITVITSFGANLSPSNFMASGLPIVTSFSPAAGAAGTQVNIYGGNFFSGASVKFGSVSAASPTITSPGQIVATVPSGATPAPITVANSVGGFTTTSNFLAGSGPIVTGFSPVIGYLAASVNISGLNLTSPATVTFNGKTQLVNSYSGSTNLQVVITNNPGALSCPVKVYTSGGNSTAPSNFTYANTPYVTDFNPVLGPVGASVTIDGANLSSASSVTINGVSQSITALTPLQIMLANNTTTGPVKVTTSAGSFTTSSNFTVTGAAPVISSYFPTNGVRGTNITFTGVNFANVTSVKFNGVSASFPTPTSSTELVATVPAGATTGFITIANSAGMATNASLFYIQPWITSSSTNAGIVNMNVTFNGRNLTNTASFQINGLNYPFTSSASQIIATIPSNASTGLIQISTPGGAFISTNNFAILPKIYAFSPNIGPAGTLVTITGTSLFDVTNVLFGGISAGVTNATTNQVQAFVPSGATNSRLSVLTAYGGDLSTNSFTVTSNSTVVLTKTVNAPIAAPGSEITYTLLVTNLGPSIITSVVVTDTMPASLTFVSATASVGTWFTVSTNVVWNLGILTNANSATLQIIASDSAPALLINTAYLSFPEGNLVPYSNTASIASFYIYNYQRTMTVAPQAHPPGLLITWPPSLVTFGVQASTNLAGPWSLIAPSNIFVTNGLNAYTDTFTLPQNFYRLAPQ